MPTNNYFLLDEFDKSDRGVKIILNEHPEVKILFERRDNLPYPLEINGVNPILHVLMEGIVENQLQDQIIPEVKEAIERLESKGLSRHAARACVTRVFIEFFHEAFHQKKEFNNNRYRCKIQLLGTDLRKLGRNEPCPCGSGVKFKRCCGADMEQFKISRIAGALCLGQGSYILGSPEFIVKDPLDPLLQLENRVHIARYLEVHGDVEGAEKALKENVALAERLQKKEFLKNALQDLQLLYLNHQSLKEKGLRVTERLIALAQDDEEKGSYWCDKADLLAQTGRVEKAEKEFQKIFSALPHWHFGRYRYALFLEDIGKKEEAKAVLQELVAKRKEIDRETYRAAREVLQRWERG